MKWNNKDDDENDRKSNEYPTEVSHTDAITPNNIKTGKGTSTQHTKPVKFKHPVENVEELNGSEAGQYLLRKAQVDDGVEPGDRSKEAEHKVELAFDLRVIDITNLVMENPVADATHGEFPITDKAVCTLVLHRVRNEAVEEFTSHLETVPKVTKELDLDEKLSKPTITAWETKLTTENTNAINACAIRVLYAVYRSGQAFPQGVWDATVASSETRLLTKEEYDEYENNAESKLAGDVTREALRNWAREWLEACVSGECLFGRNQSQVKYPATSIIGLFTHAALESRSLTGASKTCNWVVDPELVPDRRTVMELINKSNVDEIAMLFGELNQRFLQFADEYTILNEDVQLAFDPTDAENRGEAQDDHWVKGQAQTVKGKINDSDADQKWEFGFAAVTENDVRFALGMYPINARSSDNEDRREKISAADVMRRLLPSTWSETPVSPDLLVMDRGVKGVDVILRCRGAVGNNWISLWQQRENLNELNGLVEKTPENESRFYKLETQFHDLTDKPNAIVVRAPYGATNSQWIFLTDLPREEFLKETEDGEKVIDRSMIISAYQNRCRIETTLGQIKHDFEIPVRDSTGVHVRYFCLNMAMVFYNLHNLISNSLSPKYGLPLGKTRGASNGEVLCAIREVAFEMAAEEQSE